MGVGVVEAGRRGGQGSVMAAMSASIPTTRPARRRGACAGDKTPDSALCGVLREGGAGGRRDGGVKEAILPAADVAGHGMAHRSQGGEEAALL